MGFLRRLLGGPGKDGDDRASRVDEPDEANETDEAGSADGGDDERIREAELLRADAERLDDPLLQRQLRYADRAWSPPAQGGERRSGDTGAPGD